MKTRTKLIVAAALAVIVDRTAFADDQQLQNRLALKRGQMAKNQQTTIAVYGKIGLGERAMCATRGEGRWERHDTGRDTHFIRRPAR